MVSILATKHEVQLFESIPKTKVVDGRLAFGDLFEVALIDYLVVAKGDKKSELLADRLEESLLKLIKRLKADDSSKIIRERLEIGVRGDGISKKKRDLLRLIMYDQYRNSFNLLKTVGLDKVDMDIFNNKKFEEWSKRIAFRFPFENDGGASIMLTTLAKVDLDKLAESIPTTEGNADSELIADRLEEALQSLIVRLKEDDKSKSIVDRLEHVDHGDFISNSEKEVGIVDNIQPVQKLSSQQKVINKPVISLTSGLNYKEAYAFLLLKSVGLDKVETDIFNSDQFQMWLKRIMTVFDSPAIMADVMLTTLVKFDIIKVVASIPPTKFKDDKLAFGDHFKEALMDFIANGADVEYVKDSYKNLEKSVLDLINVLKSEEHSSFGEILEGEYLFTQLDKNKEGLFDIFDDSSVQKWLELQKINSKRIGEVIHQNRDNYTKKVMNDLVLYKLQSLFTVHTFEGSLAEYHLFQGWIREAFHLDAKVTSVLSILRIGLSEKWIIQFCNYLIFNDLELRNYARSIELATIEKLKSGLDNKLLDTFELIWFSFLHPMARSWMTYMTIQYKQNANSEMSKVLRSKYKSRIPQLIKEGKQSGYKPLAIMLEEDST
ncbi:hypothetical protein Plhal703r1_c37g0132731 [Plasmopara halstedii]